MGERRGRSAHCLQKLQADLIVSAMLSGGDWGLKIGDSSLQLACLHDLRGASAAQVCVSMVTVVLGRFHACRWLWA